MVIYLDEHKLQQLLAGTPRALLSRRVNEIEQNAAAYGIKTLSSGDGFVRADISGANRSYALTWLNSHAACVDVEPRDIEPLLGRSVDSLMLFRWLQNGGKLNSIEPDEIIEALETVSIRLQTEKPFVEDIDAATLEQAEQDLVNAGLIPADSGRSLEPPARQEPPTPTGEFSEEPEPQDYFDPFRVSAGL